MTGLRLCSQLRSLDRTRNAAVVHRSPRPTTSARVLRGLDIGVHDFLVRPVDRNELVARVRTQVRRKRFADGLRDSVQASMELAVTDPLTGLHNRRYLDSHRRRAVRRGGVLRGRQISVLLLDIDRFKAINDSYGHDAGDEVLREFAMRVRAHTRGIDLLARYGGEEIVVRVPDTAARRRRGRRRAHPRAASRRRRSRSIAARARVPGHRLDRRRRPRGRRHRGGEMLKRADLALYRAKQQGRNRVIAAAA